MKKFLIFLFLSIALTQSCGTEKKDSSKVVTPAKPSIKDIVASMTLDEKIGQMVQAERSKISVDEVKKYFIGSVFSSGGSTPGNTIEDWTKMCADFQKSATSTRLKIPILYGIDAVHGHNTINGAIIFPHNIGLGAANDPNLMKEIGKVTAQEMVLSGVNWNFAPCIAIGENSRWGRTYESYGQSQDLVSNLSIPYILGLQENGILACPKHYIGDGAPTWGSSKRYMLDQGNVEISMEDLKSKYLSPYKKAIDNGALSIMVSYNSINNIKCHENKEIITDILKNELKFSGIVASDYEGIHQIKAELFDDQVIKGVNAGIDMFMEPNDWKQFILSLKDAVSNSKVSQERIDDAVTRILTVKQKLGLLDDPFINNKFSAKSLASTENVKVAQKAVEESLVLLKNENNILPLKKSANIFVIGDAVDNIGIQCGGWTKTWTGGDDKDWMKGNTILDGIREITKNNNGKVYKENKDIDKCDVCILVLGEKPYSEGEGDCENLSIIGDLALPDNEININNAKNTKLPILTILVSGRPRIVNPYIDNWDGFVAAWLPGTEGSSVAKVIFGEVPFKGKLPCKWPSSMDQLPFNITNAKPLFDVGFGLK